MTKDDYAPEHQFENGELVQFNPPKSIDGPVVLGSDTLVAVRDLRDQLVEVVNYEDHVGNFVSLNKSCWNRWDWFTKIK